MDWAQLIQPVLIAASPIAVALIKRAEPPTWTLPLICAGLAVAADTLSAVVTNVSVGPTTAAALGLAGVGVREIVDQLRRALAA